MPLLQKEVVVPVKGAAASKINWKEALTIVATILALFGIEFDTATQEWIVGLIGIGSPIVGIIFRTFFTKSIVSSSI